MATRQTFQFKSTLWISFFGFFYSETQVIQKFSKLSIFGNIEVFAMSYFALSTAYLAILIYSWLADPRKKSSKGLEAFEYLGIPLSVFILNASLKDQSNVGSIIIPMTLFGVQNVLIGLKILFFGSVTDDLSSISVSIRMIRLFKLTAKVRILFASIAPIFYSFLSTFLQTVAIILVYQKNFFQLILVEYQLVITVICGLISSINLLASQFFNIPFGYIGESLMLTCFLLTLIDIYPLVNIFEHKYKLALKTDTANRSQEQKLAIFLLIKQTISNESCSIELSKDLKNLAIIEAVESIKNHQHFKENVLKSVTSTQLFSELTTQKIKFLYRFIDDVDFQFKNTEKITCLEFTISLMLKIHQNPLRALIYYYSFLEKQKGKINPFESVRLRKIYHKINQYLSKDSSHPEQVSFVSFSEKICVLREKIQMTFEKQLLLIEFLKGQQQQQSLLPEEKLLERHASKIKIRKIIQECTQYSLYSYCNEFKFLLLIYTISIEKSQSALELQLKIYFFSSEAVYFSQQVNHNLLTILRGFGKGEIVKCNEQFKSHFGIGYRKSNKQSIGDLFPSILQNKTHIKLMDQFYFEQNKNQEANDRIHKNYECFLVVENQYMDIRFKTIEAYEIDTRIYYECQDGFHYVCQLKRKVQPSNLIQTTNKQRIVLESKGIEVEPLSMRQVDQLDEKMQIFTILLDYQQRKQESQQCHKHVAPQLEDTLKKKLSIIQSKLSEQKQVKYDFSNFIEILLTLALFGFVLGSLLLVENQRLFIQQIIVKDLLALKESTIANSKAIFEFQVLQIVNGTTTFPDNLCEANGIPSMTDYMINITYEELYKSYKPFTDRVGKGLINYQIIKYVYDQNYTARGITWPGAALNKVPYVKFTQLLKADGNDYLLQKQYRVISRYIMLYYLADFFKGISMDSLQKIYAPIQQFVQSQFRILQNFTGSIRTFMCLVTTAVFIVLIGFRIWGNRTLMAYYDAICSIKSNTLERRMKQVKRVIDLLKQSEKDIKTVQINSPHSVVLNKNQKNEVKSSLKSLIKSDNRIQAEPCAQAEEETQPLLITSHKGQSQNKSSSFIIRLLQYNMGYLFLMFLILAGLLIFQNIFASYSIDKLKAIQIFSLISEQTSRIQQQYVNLIAYNWLHTLSLQSSMPLTPSTASLLSDVMTVFSESNIVKLIEQSYQPDFSLSILKGNVCRFFKNQTYCQHYKNGMFDGGFSTLLPVTIKDQKDITNFSTRYSDYFMNLCDMTQLLFEGVVPMTYNIAIQGYAYTTQKLDENTPYFMMFFLTLMVVFIALPIIYQCRNHDKIKKIRHQVLSLDSIDILYRESAIKPYFNELYYT